MFLKWLEALAICESADTYHAREELSCSKLKDLLDSPEIFVRKHIWKTEQTVATSSMDFGTAIHEDLLLEALTKGYKLIPPEVLSKSGSKAGAAWKEFQAANEGFILLKLEEAKALDEIIGAVMSHPGAMQLLATEPGDVSELTLISDVCLRQDEAYTWKIKCRLDKLKSNGTVVDVKTVGSLDLMKYRPYDHRWGLQAYLYSEAAKLHLECDRVDVRFVVVETKSPRRVRLWAPSQETLAYAEELAHGALVDLAGRTIMNDWNAKDWLEVREF